MMPPRGKAISGARKTALRGRQLTVGPPTRREKVNSERPCVVLGFS
jgi:hypothetical protein